MRIAVATRTLARVGGVEVYVERSVNGLCASGHDVRVFAEIRAETGLQVPAWLPRNGDDALLASAIRTFEPDVVVDHGLLDTDTETSLAALRPSVFFAHAYHGTCISGAKAHSFPYVRPCARTFGPACLLRYYPHRCGGLNPATMAFAYAAQQRRLAAIRRFDRVFTLSEHIAAEYAAHGVGRDRMTVLPPPVPGERGSAQSRDPNHVVYVGRLERLKGPAVAIQAVAAAAERMRRQLRLTIAGEGSAAAEVRRAAARHAGGQFVAIQVVGSLSSQGCADLFASAGLLVVPSLWPEPFGLVGLEAAAHGVPAVGFRVGGVPEWLVDGVTGHLAAPGSDPVTALRDAIVLALASPDHHAALQADTRKAHAAAVARDHIGTLQRQLESLTSGGRSS
jgi:glycosyltransferase involved in cell wall biosynthesis